MKMLPFFCVIFFLHTTVCIGTKVPINPKDAVTPIDHLSIAAPRKLRLETDLSKGAFIFSPTEPAMMAAAQQIQQRLQRRTGCQHPILTTLEQLQDYPLRDGITFGNMMNNPLLDRLYWNHYTAVTPVYPGPDAFVIKTVHSPLPVLPSNNILVLGASTPEKTAQAVTAFLDTIESDTSDQPLIFPPLLNIHGTPRASTARAEKSRRSAPALHRFRLFANLYQVTGHEQYLLDALSSLEEKVSRSEKETGWTLAWPEVLDAHKLSALWDFIAVHAVARKLITDDEFAHYEQFFLNIINRLIMTSERFDLIKPNEFTLGWNHVSIRLLGIYAITRYYHTHYPHLRQQLQICLDKAHWYFMGQAPNYRISCDATLYQLLSLKYILAYYLMTSEMQYFENGNAYKMLQLAMAQVDNNGHYVGTGDAAGPFLRFENNPNFAIEPIDGESKHPLNPINDKLFCWFDDLPASDIINYYRTVPELYWFASLPQTKYQSDSKRTFNSFFRPDIRPQAPQYLVGAVSISLCGGMYNYLSRSNIFRMTPEGYLPFAAPAYPIEMCFDKIQFRSITETGGEYLLLDGLGRGNHQHLDTNAINACVLEGYKFLVDADYHVSKSNHHNMLCVLKDGRSSVPVPSVAGLHALVNLCDSAYSCTAVKGYNDIEWRRHIYWQKNAYFLVVDTATAEQPGRYRLQNVWKVLDREMETFDGQNLICKAPSLENATVLNPITDFPPQTFHLRSTDAKGNWWTHQACTRFSIPSHRVHQNQDHTLHKGDMISFQNVFYVEREIPYGQSHQYIPHRLSQHALLLEYHPSLAIVLVENGTYGDFSLKGSFAMISSGMWFLAAVESFNIKDFFSFKSSSPISLHYVKSKLTINAPSKGFCIITTQTETLKIDFTEGQSIHELSILPLSNNKYLAALQSGEEKSKAGAKNNTQNYAALKLHLLTNQNASLTNRASDMAAGILSDEVGIAVVIASGKLLTCYLLDGTVLWQFPYKNKILSVAMGKWTLKDSSSTILFGTDNNEVVALNASGEFIQTLNITVKPSAHFGIQDSMPWVTSLYLHDIDKKGNFNLFVGSKCWQIHQYDRHFNLKWYNAMIWHGVWDVAFADMDNSGSEEIIVGDRYGAVNVLSSADMPLACRRNTTAIGNVAVDVIDIDGDGMLEVINASEGGKLTVFKRTFDGVTTFSPLWNFDTWGFGYTDVKVLYLPEPMIIAASESGYLYFINSNGELYRHVDLNRPITCLLVTANNTLFAGTEEGQVFHLNGHGKILAAAKLSDKIIRLEKITEHQIAALSRRGQLAVLSVK